MTQVVLQVDDVAFLPVLKQFLTHVKGVTVSEIKRSGIDEALEEMETGKTTRYENFKEFKSKFDV